MRVAVFLMSLCFLLWRGNTHVFTAAPDGNHVHHNQKPQKIRFTNSDYSFFTDTDLDTEDEQHVSYDDNADEDCSVDMLAQKIRLLAMCYASIPYQSILNYYHNCHNDPPSFLGQASHKYILQGVLRI